MGEELGRRLCVSDSGERTSGAVRKGCVQGGGGGEGQLGKWRGWWVGVVSKGMGCRAQPPLGGSLSSEPCSRAWHHADLQAFVGGLQSVYAIIGVCSRCLAALSFAVFPRSLAVGVLL